MSQNPNLELVAPELQPLVRRVPPLPLDSAWGRGLVRWLGRFVPPVSVPGVTIEQRNELRPALRIYRPAHRSATAALIWFHGGGLLIGQPAQDDQLCAETARELGIVVVAVTYRLVPEHPFPAALDDGIAGWAWLQQNATLLGIDPARVALGGNSAGGGLAASLAQRLRDAGGPQPIAQWLFYPMLDDRTAARRELDPLDHLVWPNRLNRVGWQAYLAAEPGQARLPAYAAAARCQDLRGLPPTWIGVGDVDLFYAENRAYAEALQTAGVATTLDLVPGAPHGFDRWAAETSIARAFVRRAQDWLTRWTGQ